MPKAKKTRPKKPPTPRTRVKNSLRQLWLKSRERSAALKRENYTCQRCGKKQSKAKGRVVSVSVHHKNGIDNWGKVIDAVFEYLLCDPDRLEVLCVGCHDDEHDARKMRDEMGYMWC